MIRIDGEKGEKGESLRASLSSFTRTMRTWCFTLANDVLPVNRTMKKYKICVTIILNFLLVIF